MKDLNLIPKIAPLLNDIQKTWAKIHAAKLKRLASMNDESPDVIDNCGEGTPFYKYITEEFSEIWMKLDAELYESKEFVIPEFKDQVEFVYNHRCKKK